MSLTRDWEYKLWPLAQQIMHLVYAYDIRNDDGETESELHDILYDDGETESELHDILYDDGETESELHDILCSFTEAIEECSNFDADTQLYNIIKQLTEPKTEKDLLSWQGKK